MKKKFIILLALSAVIIFVDQFVKNLITAHYHLGESTSVITDFFNITYVRNFGAAFGFLNETNPAFRNIFFLAMPPVALVVILFILKNVDNSDTKQIVALSSVFGGAIGNYVDRIRFGYVVDFLDFHWKEIYTYPAFNVADMTIVCGVITLLILMYFEGKTKTSQNAT